MIQDIIEEIKKVNQMIDFHSTNKDSDFMLKQYQSKRDQLISELEGLSNIKMKYIKTKPIVFVDMDGVLCNFYKAAKQALTDNPKQKYPQSQWGFFLKLEEIPGAIEGFRKLEEKYDLWILTRPSFRNVNCYTEKAQWIWDHLGFDIVEKTIMAPNKSFLKGDYLIDDMGNAGQEEFEGEWIHFKTEKFPNWETVVDYLMSK